MSPNPPETADLVTFIKEILYWKLHFCAVVVASVPLQNINWFWMTLAKLKEKSLFNFNRQWKLLVEVSALIVSKMCHSQLCWKCHWGSFLGGIYLFNFNNGNTRTMCEICSDLIVNFEQVSHIFFSFSLLILTR